jgi:predicted aspartyl protease
MIQIEQEKIQKQMGKFFQMKEIVKKINLETKHNQVGLGSLIETTNGWFFISIALGKIEIEGETIFVLSADAPIGKIMIGKKNNDTFQFNRNQSKIISIA